MPRTRRTTLQTRCVPAQLSRCCRSQADLGTLVEQDGAGSGAGVGNVLSEVTLPRPDLSGLKAMHPVRPTLSLPFVALTLELTRPARSSRSQEDLAKDTVGQVRAFPGAALEAFKALSMPTSLKREVRRLSPLAPRSPARVAR